MRRKQHRKTYQLCAQAQKALQSALAESESELLKTCYVEVVLPAPGPKKLLVLLHSFELDLSEYHDALLNALAEEKSPLRTAIAAEICRKKAPDICFELAAFYQGK